MSPDRQQSNSTEQPNRDNELPNEAAHLSENHPLSACHHKDSSSSLDMPKPVSSPRLWTDPIRLISVFTHLAFIVLLLVVVFLKKQSSYPSVRGLRILSWDLSNRLTADPNDPNVFQDIAILGSLLTVILTCMLHAYVIVITYTTQRLALRRALYQPGSLTQKHDTSAAWSGFASAALTGIKNRRPSAFKTSLIPFFYLGGIMALYSVFTASMNIMSVASLGSNITTRSIPDFRNSLGNIFLGPSSLLTINSLDSFTFTGLSNETGTLYDIPIQGNGTPVLNFVDDPLLMPATHFNVTCGTLTGKFSTVTATNLPPEVQLRLDIFPSMPVYITSIIARGALSIYAAPWTLNDTFVNWPGTLLVTTTVSVKDSNGQSVTPIVLDRPYTYPVNSTTVQVSEMVVLACNLTLNDVYARISPFDFSFMGLVDVSTVKNNSEIRPFPVTQRGLLNFSNPEDALISVWSLSSESDIAPASPINGLLDANCSQFDCIKIPDQYLMNQLGLYPDVLFPNVSSAPTILLHELENAMSRMSTIEFWVEAYGNDENFDKQILNSTFPEKNVSSVEVVHRTLPVATVTQEVPRVVVHMFHIYGSLSIAIFLFLLAIPGIIDSNKIQVSKTGILEVIWLLQETEDILPVIHAVKDPKDLRYTGQKILVAFGKKDEKTVKAV